MIVGKGSYHSSMTLFLYQLVSNLCNCQIVLNCAFIPISVIVVLIKSCEEWKEYVKLRDTRSAKIATLNKTDKSKNPVFQHLEASHRRCSIKKGILKISRISLENTNVYC